MRKVERENELSVIEGVQWVYVNAYRPFRLVSSDIRHLGQLQIEAGFCCAGEIPFLCSSLLQWRQYLSGEKRRFLCKLEKQQAPALQEGDSGTNIDCACRLKTEKLDNLDVYESNQALSVLDVAIETPKSVPHLLSYTNHECPFVSAGDKLWSEIFQNDFWRKAFRLFRYCAASFRQQILEIPGQEVSELSPSDELSKNRLEGRWFLVQELEIFSKVNQDFPIAWKLTALLFDLINQINRPLHLQNWPSLGGA